MAGTHTPTQTWHATAQYVQTGEVITESVAKEAGTFAMDNIARIVGTSTGATPQAVRRIATVADLAALKAIAASDRADQDYCAIDTANGERVYKFDSAGAGTGDDYAIVTPNAGTGRWHLVNAKPKTTTLRRVASGIEFMPDVVTAETTPAVDYSTGTRKIFYPDDIIKNAFLREFNTGDSISEIELVSDNSGAGKVLTVTFYHFRSADGGTAPTVTTMGTLTDSGTALTTQSAAVSPAIEWQAGDYILIQADCNASVGGGGEFIGLIWAAVNGTRSYITE